MKENLIKKLIDSRIIEATKKRISHKLQMIARNLGSEIVGEYSYASMLPDFWEYELDDPYDASRVVDASHHAESSLGWVYDSLTTGVNLEIVVRSHSGNVNLVRATFNGNPVFLEEEGDILGYAPFSEWETHVEKVYEYAAKKEEERGKFEKGLEREDNRRKTMSFLQKLKRLWGF